MAQNKGGKSRKHESLAFNGMTFFIILIVVVLLILSLVTVFHQDEKETGADNTTASVTTDIPVIATTGSANTADTVSTSPATVGTTYPTATLPTGTNKPWPTETTKQTTAVFTTLATTAATTATEKPVSPKPVPDNITEKEMSKIIEKRYLTIHPDSRPGKHLISLDNVVVHYVANPGTTADQNWRYFENEKPSASAHFIIGLEGEIIQAIPTDEVAWAVGTKEGNYTSISIECCHPDETGKFTDATYNSLIRLVSYLCNKFNLGREDVLRHYDYDRYTPSGQVWHKQCPLYYANDNDPASHERWKALKQDLIIYKE